MHQEYAINPDGICESWDRFLRFWGNCGFSKGRLISKFPSKWKREVFRSDSFRKLTPIKQQRVEVLLAKDSDRLVASHRAYDQDAKSWLEAAIISDKAKPFYAIIDEENPDGYPKVLSFDDADEESLWAVDTCKQINRTEDAMGESVRHLLSNCREVRFIDPYFSFKPELTAPFKRFLEHLVPFASRLDCLEVHFKHSNYVRDLQWEDFVTRFKREVVSKQRFYLPEGGEELIDKLVFHAWDDSDAETLHARCIVTDLGGLNFERGLDISSQHAATNLVSMMSERDVTDYKVRYTQGTSPFIHKGMFRASEIVK
ncbi:MAG: hypothetical protein ACON4O_05490 [Lentimonas sp.]